MTLPALVESPRLLRAATRLAPRSLPPAAFRWPIRLGAERESSTEAGARLFVDERARQRLERLLGRACGVPVRLGITDARHALVASVRRDGFLQVRVHYMFLLAPAPLHRALAAYLAHGDAAASGELGSYIEAHEALLLRRPPPRQGWRGVHHDLLVLAQRLQQRFFSAPLPAVTWGRAVRVALPRRSIRLGSYDPRERLIRIHPVLDRAWVPRYFVAAVLFHELLHHELPPQRHNGRRQLHPPEFLERERQFPQHAQAMAWQRKHLHRLLSAQ